MSTLRFINRYNNYYNRIIKHDELTDLSSYTYQDFSNINFNPNDGLYTEQIVNWSNTWTPDYMMEIDSNAILSRWFVLEWQRTRGKQYKAILKRDVIADNYT